MGPQRANVGPKWANFGPNLQKLNFNGFVLVKYNRILNFIKIGGFLKDGPKWALRGPMLGPKWANFGPI